MRAYRLGLGIAFGALGWFAGVRAAHAHPSRPAVLALRELSPGRFAVRWSPPTDEASLAIQPQPHFPGHCQVQSRVLVDCGARGLAGVLRFDDLASLGRVTVYIQWLNGPREMRIASGDPAVLVLAGTPLGAPLGPRLALARSYALMGIRHILFGIDHLMFVTGLLLFVRSMRRLLVTITSFTLAHSLTLAAASLDLVHLPSGPVELSIALSILLLAVEASRQHQTFTQRAPWLVAFVFGLLHGFGFASALAEVGLPPQHVPLALASFNVGVEVGQLMSVAIVAVGWRVLSRNGRAAKWAPAGAMYLLGIASVYWCLERGLAMWHARG